MGAKRREVQNKTALLLKETRVPVQFYFVCDREILRDGAIESAFLSFYKVDKILGILSK